MHNLFLDANVLFTVAHNPGGKAYFLFAVATELRPPWRLLSSAYAIEEARRNLAAKSPGSKAEFERITGALIVVRQPGASAIIWICLPTTNPSGPPHLRRVCRTC